MDLPLDLRDIKATKDTTTTVTTNEDKASQSSCKVAPLISLEKKESPMNPYNRADWARMNPKWPLPDTEYNELSAVNSLPQLDCGTFPKSYMDTCSCCPRETFDKHGTDATVNYTSVILKDEECCRAHWIRKEAYQRIKAKVARAVKRHKIFLIRGEVPKLKEALERRGWVQKYEATKTRTLPYGSVASLEARSLGDLTHQDGTLNEKAVIFALLRHKSPDFIWDCRNDFVDWHRGLSSNTLLNRYQKPSVYTSKLGMARLLEEAHWLYERDVSGVLFPRSYNLSREPKAFLEDFRLTATAGLLKWFVQRMQDDQDTVDLGQRTIPMSRLEFAIKRCEEFIACANHQNIDEDFVTELSEEEWNLFLEDYTAAVHNGGGIENTSEKSDEQLQKYYEAANSTLSKLKEVDPQYDLNGMRNIWILKPSELCCGTGISISHSLKDIFRKVKSRPKDYFIVQKYVERPLLIHDTKFDIRQWYLVTNTFPMTIWTFKQVGYEGEPYYGQIYRKMSEAIVLTMLASQEQMDRRRCSFELYGADFVVMEDLSVWLIEINTNPRMHPPSSRITKRLYSSVLQSLVKVIMDVPVNPAADTGGFSLVYKQNIPDFRPYLGPCLFVFGKSITLQEHPRKRDKKKKVSSLMKQQQQQPQQQQQHRAWTAPPMIPRLREPKIVDFIDYLNTARCTAAN